MLFRRDAASAGPSAPEGPSKLVLREGFDLPEPQPSAGGPRESRKDDETATVLAPLDSAEPPHLPRDYPEAAGLPDQASVESGATRGSPVGPVDRPRVHKVVDGDTLGGLAERYLGSVERYWEIYEANRDVLPSPQVLPIGAKLRIPLKNAVVSPSANMMPKRPLVPVQRN